MQIIKKKRKQILKTSDEEKKEEKEKQKDTSNNKDDDSKVNTIEYEIKSIDGFPEGPGNYRRGFLPMLIWKKEIEMLLSLLKSFRMKDVNAIDDVYPHDVKMAKNQTVSSSNFGREIANLEES